MPDYPKRDLDEHSAALLSEIISNPGKYPAFSRMVRLRNELAKFDSGKSKRKLAASRRKFLMLLTMPFVSFTASKALSAIERRKGIARNVLRSDSALSGVLTAFPHVTTAYLHEDLVRDAVEKAGEKLSWLGQQRMFEKLPPKVQAALTIKPEALIAPAHEVNLVEKIVGNPQGATGRAMRRTALATALLQPPATLGGEPFASAALSLASAIPVRMAMTGRHAEVVGMLERDFSQDALELEMNRLHSHWEKLLEPQRWHGRRRR